MPILLILPVIVAVAAFQRYLQVYAPSNLLARRVRAHEPRWQTTAVLIVLVGLLLVAMHVLAEAVAHGASGWLNLIVLVLAWDGIKLGLLALNVGLRAFARAIEQLARPDRLRGDPAMITSR